jgi:poly-gamma-glutamate capsule biosynthesis protein CapA/YwtB (metallophosphatase superfamily)
VIFVAAVGGVALVVTAIRISGRAEPAVSPGARSTTASPSPSVVVSTFPSPTGSASSRGSLVIHGAGDVSLDPTFITTYGSLGYGYAWSGLSGLFGRDDLTVVNQECPVSNLGTKWPGKQFNFRGDPRALPAMKAAGVEVASMANNHAYDYGPVALLDTRKNDLAAGIQPVGAGKDPAEANAPAIFHLQGWTVAVVGLDQVIDPDPEEVARPGHPGTSDGHDFPAMLAAVRAAAAISDLVVVDIHWGVELDTQPRSYQVEQGHRLIAAGADIIFGGHSHRLQPLEMYRGRPIFYSLGNFVWPNFSVEGATTGVAEVRVSASGHLTARMIPAFITAPGHPVLRGS